MTSQYLELARVLQINGSAMREAAAIGAGQEGAAYRAHNWQIANAVTENFATVIDSLLQAAAVEEGLARIAKYPPKTPHEQIADMVFQIIPKRAAELRASLTTTKDAG